MTYCSIYRDVIKEHVFICLVCSMTEEAMNLVSKLIEEDQMSGSRVSSSSGHSNKASSNNSASSQGLIGGVGGRGGDSVNNKVALGLDELAANPALLKNIPVSGVGPGVVNHTASMDVWLYRDPQGSVQGPFPTHEMALWYSQGYFSANLLLRRECDKVFVTLLEMGRLYGRNPFAIHHESPPPPPIMVCYRSYCCTMHVIQKFDDIFLSICANYLLQNAGTSWKCLRSPPK